MVFNYVLPTGDGSVLTADYGNVQDMDYSLSINRNTTPRRYATVAPADVYTPAVAPFPMSTGRDYGQTTGSAQYTPSYSDGYDKATRETAIGNQRYSSYDRGQSSRGYEVQTVAPNRSTRYYCDIADCVDDNGRRKSVGRKADLKRHMDTVHGKPTIDCQYSRCTRRGEDGFRREDHYKEHLRGYHNADIPKADRSRRGS